MWECPKCKVVSSNPEQHWKHLSNNQKCKEFAMSQSFGWQSVELSGFPRTKTGELLWQTQETNPITTHTKETND